jgi:tRNA-dihydrouridine synthase
MLGRGPVRNPFIFLESYIDQGEKLYFLPSDYWEVIQKLYTFTQKYTQRERTLLVQMRKHIVWLAAGFSKCAQFRGSMFESKDIDDTLKIAEDYFLSLAKIPNYINHDQAFMNGGHG